EEIKMQRYVSNPTFSIKRRLCPAGKPVNLPKRHVGISHMVARPFRCPHCECHSTKMRRVTRHMDALHNGLGGDVDISLQAELQGNFNEMKARCFGVGAGSSGASRRDKCDLMDKYS
ncbi:MAG: hypothetical protein GY820_34800, partial [Gammaproteobacteria bacterium]|nr:hypothetical protein [Gammaproteobacteria bacterium]